MERNVHEGQIRGRFGSSKVSYSPSLERFPCVQEGSIKACG